MRHLSGIFAQLSIWRLALGGPWLAQDPIRAADRRITDC
jgi:hypothetical protein